MTETDPALTAAAPESLLASADMPPQSQITQEIVDLHRAANEREAVGEDVPATLYDFPPYRSSILRHPTKNPRLVDPESIELRLPAYGQRDVAAIESDLTLQHTGEPQGERITVQGRVLDSWGRPLRNQLVTPEGSAAVLADGIPGGRIARIAGAAHLPAAEQPAALAAVLLDFFDAANERSGK